jgi:uncharacterized membrane protein YgcG
MAFVLVAVAGAGALVVTGYRWWSRTDDNQSSLRDDGAGQAPLSDDAYWGMHTGYDPSVGGSSQPSQPPQPQQQQQQQQQQLPSPSWTREVPLDWQLPGGAAPRISGQYVASPSPPLYPYAPAVVAAGGVLQPPPPPPPSSQLEACHHHTPQDVAALQAANVQLEASLVRERQRVEVLTRGVSEQELELRRSVLELNARLLDAEDARAVEREEREEREAMMGRQLAAAAAAHAETGVREGEEGQGAAPGGGSSSGQSGGGTVEERRGGEGGIDGGGGGGGGGGASSPRLCDFEIPFGELELQEVVGEGGFGRVHRGVWRGGAVAVKQLFCTAERIKGSVLAEFRAEVVSRPFPSWNRSVLTEI